MIVKHPAFPDVQRDVPDADADRWKAAGWLPLLDEAQAARFREIEAEVDASAASEPAEHNPQHARRPRTH